MGYIFNLSEERLKLYAEFVPNSYDKLTQVEREQLVEDTIQQICIDKELPNIFVFFNKESKDIGSYNVNSENPKLNYINIQML